jgi:four helix bundle protein
LTDQVRRSSRAVGANICEAWAKRRYEAHFISKLTDSDGEREETVHWVSSACACQYISDSVKRELIVRLAHLGAMINTMIACAGSWCLEEKEHQQ